MQSEDRGHSAPSGVMCNLLPRYVTSVYFGKEALPVDLVLMQLFLRGTFYEEFTLRNSAFLLWCKYAKLPLS